MQIVVRQISGLGNQMFQYAAGRYYARRYGAQMRMAVDPARNAISHGHPRPFLLSNFEIKSPANELSVTDRFVLNQRRGIRPISAAFRESLGIQMFTEAFEQRYTFMPDLPLQKNVRTLYLAGYWQAHRFADDIADELRSEFRFKQPAQGKNLEVLEQIGQSRTPVSLHVRRGDYTLAAEGNIALPIDYYSHAISAFRKRLDDPDFFIFSDDIPFTREHLPRGIRATFVDHNDASSSHEDLRLMSCCHHHIIANSTFSWWGAWLNSRPGKMVFAPKYWLLKRDSHYPDLLPPTWMLADTPDTILA
jgi:hypothetical protein